MKLKCMIMTLLLCISTALPVTAAEETINFDTPITVTVNQHLIQTDVKPFLYRGTTYVPIRFISEALGVENISWHPDTGSAVIEFEGNTLVLQKNTNDAYLNGSRLQVSGGIRLVENRLFVPVRFVAESLNCTVDWVYESYTVAITKPDVNVPQHLIGSRSYTDDEIYWLSKIIHAESRGEPMEGKIAVANVILNRVESEEYPNTIYGVIFDQRHGIQFSPVLDGSIYLTPYGDSIIAAKRALEGENPIEDCLFFLNPQSATNFWIVNSRTFYTTIQNHDFYL